MESILKKTFSWNNLTVPERSYFPSSSAYYESLVGYCVSQQIPYQPAFESISDAEYYEKVLTESAKAMNVYPYHLMCYLSDSNYMSDYEYYSKIVENCLVSNTVYERIPPLVVLDIKRKLKIDKAKYEELMKESKGSGIWGYFKTKSSLVSQIMPKDAEIDMNPNWIIKLVNVTGENSVNESETYQKIKNSANPIVNDFDQKELQDLYFKKLIYFYPNVCLSDYYYSESVDPIINHKLDNNNTTKICIKILNFLLKQHVNLEEMFNKLDIDSNLGISLISLLADSNIISNRKHENNFININVLTNSTKKTIDELIKEKNNLGCLKTLQNIDWILNYEEITDESNALKRIKFENECKAIVLCYPTFVSYKISRLPVFGPISYLYETPWLKLFIYSKCGNLPVWIYPKGTHLSTLPEKIFDYPLLKITKWSDNSSEIIPTNSAILKINSYLPQTHLFIQALLNDDVQKHNFPERINVENSSFFLMDRTFGTYETIRDSEDKEVIVDIKYGINENDNNDFDLQFIENEQMDQLAQLQLKLTEELNTFVKFLSSDKYIPVYPIYGNNKIITKY